MRALGCPLLLLTMFLGTAVPVSAGRHEDAPQLSMQAYLQGQKTKNQSRTKRVRLDDEPEVWIEDSFTIVEVGETFSLFACGYPEDGSLTINWDLGDGTHYEGEEVTHSYNSRGAYRVEAVGTDESGAVSPPFAIFVFVNDPEDYDDNLEPTASIEVPQFGAMFPENADVSFQALGRDPDGDALTFFWDFGDGSPQMGPSVSKQYAHAEFNDAGLLGVFDVSLYVRDSRGLTSWDEYWLPIAIYPDEIPTDGEIKEPALRSPDRNALNFEDEIIYMREDDVLHLVGGAKGDDSTAGLDGYWLVEDENGVPVTSANGLTWDLHVDLLQPDMGHIIAFHVFDESKGQWDPVPDLRFVYTKIGNDPPEDVSIEEPGWDEGYLVGEGIELAADADDDDGDDLTYTWKITSVDDPSNVICLEGERAYLALEEVGLWLIELSAADPEGLTTKAAVNRYVFIYADEADYDLMPEVVGASPPEHHIQLRKDAMLSFAATATPSEGRQIVRYHWDANGQSQTVSTPTLTGIRFTKPGYHLVKVSAQDDHGNWGEPAYWEMFVYSNNVPPSVSIIDPLPVEHEYEFYERAIYTRPNRGIVLTGQTIDHDGANPATPHWFVAKLALEDDELEVVDDDELEDQISGDWSPTFSFDEPGLYVVALEAEDEEGEWSIFGDYRIIIVLDDITLAQTHLIEPAGDLVVEPGEELYFLAFGEHPGLLEMQLEWDFGPTANIPAGTLENDVYPVSFPNPSPEGQPYVVSVRAKNATVTTYDGEVINVADPTPATVNITVKRFDDSEFEPNNTLDEAPVIAHGAYKSLQLTGGEDDVDYFRFEITKGNNDLRLSLSETGGAGILSLTFYRLINDLWQVWSAGNVSADAGGGLVTLENLPTGSYAVCIELTEEAAKQRRALGYSFGVATLEPALYLPFMVEDGSFSSSVGIINTTGELAELAIQGLNASGGPVSCKSMELPPNGRIFLTGKALFGQMNGKAVARDVSWLKVSSTHRLLGYTNSQSLDNKQLSSVGAVRTLSSAALIPHVAKATQTWYTRAIMVNVDQGSQALDFEFPAGTMPVAPSLKAGQQVDFRFTDLFSNTALPEWGRFKNPSNNATLAGFEMFGRVDGYQQVAGLEMVDLRDKNPNFTQNNGNIYFTHVAAQDIFWTGISLINTDKTEATYHLIAYDANGGEVARMADQTLPVGGKLRTTSALLWPDRTDIAWVAVETGFEMAGFELFGDYDGKILSGFKATRFLTDKLFFPHLQVQNGAWYTGIALLNVAPSAVELELTLYSNDGMVLLQKTETLEPGRKLVRLAQSIFAEGLPTNNAYLVVRATGGQRVLSGFEIFGTLDPNALWGELLGGLPALKD